MAIIVISMLKFNLQVQTRFFRAVPKMLRNLKTLCRKFRKNATGDHDF
jgi:hypothetical protein